MCLLRDNVLIRMLGAKYIRLEWGTKVENVSKGRKQVGREERGGQVGRKQSLGVTRRPSHSGWLAVTGARKIEE